MWLTHDCHVTPRYSQLLLRMRAVDALPCQNMRCHDNHMTCCILCAPESTRCVPDPLLLLGVGSGDEILRRWRTILRIFLVRAMGL
jgi:hypothetical protein